MFKVNDVVYARHFGYGVVVQILGDIEHNYHPVKVMFGLRKEFFTKEGRFYKDSKSEKYDILKVTDIKDILIFDSALEASIEFYTQFTKYNEVPTNFGFINNLGEREMIKDWVYHWKEEVTYFLKVIQSEEDNV